VRGGIRVPLLTRMPGLHPHITGGASLRGEPVPVIVLRSAIGFPPPRVQDTQQNLLITESNRTIQSFLVG
ncbi:chemotaxis protein CheW, partial [Vibrio cholerae O1]|nr:chemotaxis protein CheW [Vibrio cholerae O1]